MNRALADDGRDDGMQNPDGEGGTNGLVDVDPWGEDVEFPLTDWRYEVANDDTRLGYLAWVANARAVRDGD